MKTQPDVDHLTTGDLWREEKKERKMKKKGCSYLNCCKLA